MSSRSSVKDELIPGVLGAILKNSTQLDSVVRLVEQQYFAGDQGPEHQSFVPHFSQLLDDALFTSCVYQTQLMHAETSAAPLYAYLFNYKGQQTPSYSAEFGDLLRRSGFHHPIINTGAVYINQRKISRVL